MGRGVIVFVLACAVIAAVDARRRTCSCDYKICDRHNKCEEGDVTDITYKGFIVGCPSTKIRCKRDCPNHVRSELGNPEDGTPGGRSLVCSRFPHSTDNEGVRVIAVRKPSDCSGQIESDILGHNSLCCHRRCTCNLISRQKIGWKVQVNNLNVYLPRPRIPNHYNCQRRLTDLCEADCKQSLRHPNSLRAPYINNYSGQKICSSFGGRKVAHPGFTVSVDYDIGDKHDHHFDLGGGTVCCGCTCRLTYNYGLKKNVKLDVDLPQTAAWKYFKCSSHAGECNTICRSAAFKALGKTTAITNEDTLGFKVCKAIGDHIRDKQPLSLNSEFDYGKGYKKSAIAKFCCYRVPFPPYFFSYRC